MPPCRQEARLWRFIVNPRWRLWAHTIARASTFLNRDTAELRGRISAKAASATTSAEARRRAIAASASPSNTARRRYLSHDTSSSTMIDLARANRRYHLQHHYFAMMTSLTPHRRRRLAMAARPLCASSILPILLTPIRAGRTPWRLSSA